MLFVDNQNMTDPRLNLALEEYLLRHVTIAEPMVLFYVNEPAVIMGRNQNTLEEIDPEYVQAQGIHLVRRLSGGGAVFHDLGNLNFSFITPGSDDLHNFARFTEPVIQALRGLGAAAELRGKSDIFVQGKKISGNAQYASQGRMFSHGTILFDTDLGRMLQALNPRRVQITSNAVQSVRNFVLNIRELLPPEMDIQGLKRALLRQIFGGEVWPRYELTAVSWQHVAQIADTRYRTWEWNVGHSPKFNVQKSERLPVGKIDVRLEVENGRIHTIKFYGDFTGQQEITDLENRLTGLRYDPATLADALSQIDPTPYFGSISLTDWLQMLY